MREPQGDSPLGPHSNKPEGNQLSFLGVPEAQLFVPDSKDYLLRSLVSLVASENAKSEKERKDADTLLEDLKRTPFIQENFAPSSLMLIGSGGMGFVFAALDPNLQQFRAIKVLPTAHSPAESESFKREAVTMAALNHANLARIYNYGVSSAGHPFFVMDLVEKARTFNTAIENFFEVAVTDVAKVQWRTRENPLVRIFMETLDAVEYLHGQGIIHHDLKPANILISSEQLNTSHGRTIQQQKVFVTDFGLSQKQYVGESLPQDRTSTEPNPAAGSMFRGTIIYSAPEQLPGRGPVSQRTDVYQLGLILRQLLVNQVPFENAAKSLPGDILRQISSAADSDALYGDPLALNPTLPRELVAIMRKALSIDPQHRYPSAAELRKDLEAFLDARRVEAFADTLPVLSSMQYTTRVATNAVRRWASSNKLVASGLLVLSLGGIAGGTRIVQRQRQDAEKAIAALKVEAEADKIATEMRAARKRTEEVVSASRALANEGDNLDAAVALVQPELVRDLEQYAFRDPQFKEAIDELKQEHEERKHLLEMRKLELKGHVAAFPENSDRLIGSFDRDALLAARACFLPQGLTAEGIEKFAEKMRSSHYSQQQRREIAERITHISFCVMVNDVNDVPWSYALSPEVRRSLAEECDRITSACLACGVELEGDPGKLATPSYPERVKHMIALADNPNAPAFVFKNRAFRCDISLKLMFAAFGLSARKEPADTFEKEVLLRSAEQSLRVDPASFLNNVLFTQTTLAFMDGPLEERFKTLQTALTSLVTAHRQLYREGIKLSSLELKLCRVVGDWSRLSLSLPLNERPEGQALLIELGTVLNQEISLSEHPVAKRALALTQLREAVGSDELDRIASQLKAVPEFAQDALLISVWNDLSRNRPLNQEDAETLLRGDLASTAPLLAAAIYAAVGRHEEAIALAEKISREKDWSYDLQRMKSTTLREISTRYPSRFSAISQASH
jgi:serine/threonine protein kinase